MFMWLLAVHGQAQAYSRVLQKDLPLAASSQAEQPCPITARKGPSILNWNLGCHGCCPSIAFARRCTLCCSALGCCCFALPRRSSDMAPDDCGALTTLSCRGAFCSSSRASVSGLSSRLHQKPHVALQAHRGRSASAGEVAAGFLPLNQVPATLFICACLSVQQLT